MRVSRNILLRVVPFALVGACAAALMAHVVACHEDKPASGMTVVFQKWDYANHCYATLPGSDPNAPGIDVTSDAGDAGDDAGGPLPSLGARTCPTPSSSTALVAGADLMRMIIGYGALEFDPSNPAPKPTITMSLDGVLSTPPLQSEPASASPAVFVVTFPVPQQLANTMTLSVRAADGFSSDTVGAFSLGAPKASVAISQCDGGSDTSCGFVSGVGNATVVLTMPGYAQATGMLASVVNGVQASTTPITLASSGTLGTLQVTTTVPVPAGTTWTLVGQAGNGVPGASQTVALGPATGTVRVDECGDASACERTADVGSVTVDITLPGTTGATAMLTSSFDNVPQPGSINVQLANVPGTNLLKGTAFPQVPAAPEGTKWTLTASLGGESATSIDIVLHRPVITSQLGACLQGTPCPIDGGASVVLSVAAPLNINATQGTVTSFIQGGASLGSLMVDLAPNLTDASAVGTINLTAPTHTGVTWVIDTNVGGYHAQSVSATVQ